ncbi:MAG: hypothetical protein KC620_04620, partial [Myxococcales bacterium]|nr:hypothetical protein [Myxococcales bacterium]
TAPVPTPVAAGPRYWLVLTNQAPGHYKMLLTCNGAPVAEVPASSPQYIADLTDKVRPGQNNVQITYLPVPSAPPGPMVDAVKVMVGYGRNAADGTLTIENVLGSHEQKTGRASAEAATITFQLQ